MTDDTQASLVKLGDEDLTVADPAEDIRGRKVVDKSGDEIGDVDALMIDTQESKVRFLQVGAGGFLGIGEKHFLIPVDAITRIDDDTVHVDQSKDRLIDAPAYDPDIVQEPDYYTGIYDYYGYAPFWAPGYTYPAYPYCTGQ